MIDSAPIALALMNLIVGSQYPLIGVFHYPDGLHNYSLQVTSDMKNWYDVPDEDTFILPNGDWVIIDPRKEYTVGPQNKTLPKDYRFYRVVGNK